MQAISGKNVVKKPIQNSKNFDLLIHTNNTLFIGYFHLIFDKIIAVLE